MVDICEFCGESSWKQKYRFFATHLAVYHKLRNLRYKGKAPTYDDPRMFCEACEAQFFSLFDFRLHIQEYHKIFSVPVEKDLPDISMEIPKTRVSRQPNFTSIQKLEVNQTAPTIKRRRRTKTKSLDIPKKTGRPRKKRNAPSTAHAKETAAADNNKNPIDSTLREICNDSTSTDSNRNDFIMHRQATLPSSSLSDAINSNTSCDDNKPQQASTQSHNFPDLRDPSNYCKVCLKTFQSSPTFFSHCKRMHQMDIEQYFSTQSNQSNLNELNKYCKRCNQPYRNKEIHIQQCQPQQSNPQSINDNEIYCYVCCKRFQKPNSLFRHNCMVHKKPEHDKQMYCEQCNILFRTKSTFLKHFIQKHGMKEELPPNLLDPEYRCKNCDVKFPHRRNLFKHCETVHCLNLQEVLSKIRPDFPNPKNFCNICHEGFKTTINFKIHCERRHKMVFSENQDLLNKHCQQSVSRQMSDQVCSNKSIDPKNYCKLCNRKFKNLAGYRQHYLMHKSKEATGPPKIRFIVKSPVSGTPVLEESNSNCASSLEDWRESLKSLSPTNLADIPSASCSTGSQHKSLFDKLNEDGPENSGTLDSFISEIDDLPVKDTCDESEEHNPNAIEKEKPEIEQRSNSSSFASDNILPDKKKLPVPDVVEKEEQGGNLSAQPVSSDSVFQDRSYVDTRTNERTAKQVSRRKIVSQTQRRREKHKGKLAIPKTQVELQVSAPEKSKSIDTSPPASIALKGMHTEHEEPKSCNKLQEDTQTDRLDLISLLLSEFIPPTPHSLLTMECDTRVEHLPSPKEHTAHERTYQGLKEGVPFSKPSSPAPEPSLTTSDDIVFPKSTNIANKEDRTYDETAPDRNSLPLPVPALPAATSNTMRQNLLNLLRASMTMLSELSAPTSKVIDIQEENLISGIKRKLQTEEASETTTATTTMLGANDTSQPELTHTAPLKRARAMPSKPRNGSSIARLSSPLSFSTRSKSATVVNVDVIPNNYTCHMCQELFTSCNSYREHSEKVHHVVYKSTADILPEWDHPKLYCRVCNQAFESFNLYKTHLLMTHEIEYPPTPVFSSCKLCNEVFTSANIRREHMALSHYYCTRKQWFCPLCDLIFTNFSTMSEHVRMEHTVIECYECKTRFSSMAGAHLHKEKCPGSEPRYVVGMS